VRQILAPTILARALVRVVAAVLATCLCAAGSTWAGPAVRVHSDGDCPTAAQVASALDYLLKGSGQTVAADTAVTDLVLEVAELGQRYRVSLAGQSREYEDPAQDCEERARVAAVFAAITLEPPEVRSHTKAPAPPASRTFELRVAAVADLGLQSAHPAQAWGGELRAILSGQRWGIELGVGGQAPAELTWGTYHAKVTRFPFDLCLRGIFRRAHVVSSLSAGVALAIFNLRGEVSSMPVQEGGTRLDLGFRSALAIELLPDARLAPFLALHASVWPRRYAAIVEPIGQVGAIPLVWVGAALGVAIR
jgi:hypothetical protein